MQNKLLILILLLISSFAFGQSPPDSISNKIITIKKEKIIEGEVLAFCNGLSLDFGEHPGLVVIKEKKTNKIFNVLLSPYKVYDFKLKKTIKIEVQPLSDLRNDIHKLELMCEDKCMGNVFVGMKEK